MSIPETNLLLQYMTPDGRLTVEGQKVFQQIIATLKDHEARITTLEP